jgi:hypothetical protein
MALDPRLALAFGAYRTRLWRVIAARVVSVAALLAIALYVRHWGTWVLFGVVGFLQAGGAIALLFVSRMPGRLRAQLDADDAELAWLHSAPEPRTKLHRVELYTRAGDMTVLFVPAAVAAGAIDAARALSHGPTVTTDAVEHAAAEPRQRLAGKLVKLEREARATQAPKLAEQAIVASAAINAWRDHLARAGAHPYRAERDAARAIVGTTGSGALDGPLPEVEARVDKLLILYASAKLGEDHRVKVDAIVRDKSLPDGLIEGELFTREIALALAELQALAESSRVLAPALTV